MIQPKAAEFKSAIEDITQKKVKFFMIAAILVDEDYNQSMLTSSEGESSIEELVQLEMNLITDVETEAYRTKSKLKIMKISR